MWFPPDHSGFVPRVLRGVPERDREAVLRRWAEREKSFRDWRALMQARPDESTHGGGEDD